MTARNIQTEVDASYLYHILEIHEDNVNVKEVFSEMSKIEASHAKAFLKHKGLDDSVLPKPSLRARIIAYLGKILGYDFVLNTLLETEQTLSNHIKKARNIGGSDFSISDSAHVQILKNIISKNNVSGHELSRFEKQHHNIGGNALRAAVLGGNDGLLSTFSLVMGVAGATMDQYIVVLSGISGLLAGSFAMSLGEWISVRSSQELYENQMEIEKHELEINPQGEEQEIALIYQAKGIEKNQAKEMAANLMQDRAKAYQLLVTEELGINPAEMKNSPWEAAIASFFMFAFGAIVPLAPFFFVGGTEGIIWSAICSALGLFFIGSTITLFTGKNFWYSGLRMVFFGIMAAGITFIIGRFLGTTIISG